ncbi:profilin [Choiromyces venosus 120613-1]|uniref:Profilin n=1 Tax=Choiromyces venosus 120613-1 TaxID=1336337 RepID=A0A3N4JDT2_9PEZI|nr:profilin [Choiromyces venosus 120613-1]
MSWQSYVDTTLIGSKKLDAAAIFSATGDSVWAASNFKIEPAEMQALIAAYQSQDKMNELASTGFHIDGTKYFTIKSEDRSIYGKQLKTGIICVKTKQAILVAHFPDTVQPGEAASVVEKLADYLIDVGF